MILSDVKNLVLLKVGKPKQLLVVITNLNGHSTMPKITILE